MQQPSFTDPGSDIFEGANHVLHGIETQIDFWNRLDDFPVEKSEMIPALTTAADALRAAIRRARTTTKS